ncbi:hypothetical protein BKA70DRAFT_1558566 [Coprinopsis sp. MPI-PUGE-AT-0042]|nr:hypothetical protein BKA70DRAFT_1558566 [Coprinopsis sp. MPI-PUGE-AT-0042]
MPVFSKLLPVAAASYGLQAILAGICVPLQTDVFFDAGGSLGWLTTTFISVYYPTLKTLFWDRIHTTFPPMTSLSLRQLLLNAAVSLWTIRLGVYLGARTLKSGGDARFAEIKKNPSRFSGFWFGQATWIFLVGLPIWLTNTLPPSLEPDLGPRDYLGIGLWAASFLVEVVADWQKSSWQRAKKRKLHHEKFISSGLWSLSRHPNYVGEVGIWTGVWVLASGAFQTSHFPLGTTALAAVSPLMTWFLLTKVSGIPGMERLGDKRFGNDPKYQEYKRNVPVFWPRLWGSGIRLN